MLAINIMNYHSIAHKPLPAQFAGPKFSSIAELRLWLDARDVPLSEWGVKDRKTILDLWHEVARGEILLADDPPHRRLHVAQVIIRRGDHILIEAEQEFHRGGRRRRERPPAEKMRPGESAVDAVVRCLVEELGVTPAMVRVLTETYRQVSHEDDSQSYPGLRSRWHFHRLEAEVMGLPATDFVTDETDTNPEDPIRRHYWTWRPEALDVT